MINYYSIIFFRDDFPMMHHLLKRLSFSIRPTNRLSAKVYNFCCFPTNVVYKNDYPMKILDSEYEKEWFSTEYKFVNVL
jgi:hypothetical protein